MAPPVTSVGTTVKWLASIVLGATNIRVNYGTLNVVRSADLSGAAETVLPTHRSRGSVSFDFNFDPDDTVHKALITDFLGKTPRAVIVTLADATPTTLTGTGLITSLAVPSADMTGPLTGSCTIELTDDWALL